MGCYNSKLVDYEDELDKGGKIQTVFRQNNCYSNNRPKDYALRKVKESALQCSNRTENSKTRANKKGKSSQNESAHQRIIADHRINAKYKVKAVIGKGSFSRVVRVEDRITKQPYAIKMIETIEGQSVFEAELGVLRRVNHPNVIHLIEVIESGGKIYMVMELALGGSLLDRLETEASKRFTEVDAVKVLRMVLNALIYLHNLGITHRDLKPDNLLYYHSGPDSKIMITDFGFASTPKCTGNPYMHTVCGTPQYIAPEIVMRRPYTSAVDMWSMGVICYILLSGTFPFDAEQDSIIYKQIIKGSYNLNGEVWDGVSDYGKDFISSLLQHDPESRLTAAEAVAHKWIKNVELSKKCLKSNLRGTGSQNSARSTASSISRRSSRSLRSDHHRVQPAHLEALWTDPEVSEIVVPL